MSKMATESRRYEDGSIFALVSPAWFVVCRVREGPKRLSIGCWRGGSEGPLRKVAPTTTTSLTTTLQQTENGARRREGHFGKWPLQLQHPLQRPYNKPKMVQGAERATSESGPYNYNIPYNDPTTNRKWCKAQRGPLRKVAPTTTTAKNERDDWRRPRRTMEGTSSELAICVASGVAKAFDFGRYVGFFL